MPTLINQSLERIVSKGAEYLSLRDLDLIRRAYEFTRSSFNRAHLVRYSGEPAIIHPLCVAEALIDWRMDAASIAAGILHDILEDTPVSAFQLHATFKDEVTFLVEGMTKLRKFDLRADIDINVAYHHHIFLMSASDIRVAIIKLADRLHNMRTLRHLPAQKRINNCIETQKIFIPLARFLGMKIVKDEYEDISLSYLDEDGFNRASREFLRAWKEETPFFEPACERIMESLDSRGIDARVSRRDYNLAHFHDEYLGAQRSGQKLSGFINITTRTENDCYAAIGAVHALFEPVQGGFMDTIPFPTADLKRWVETNVHDAGSRFKVRIFSEEMSNVNDLGIIPFLVSPSELERTDFLQDRLREIYDILHQMRPVEDQNSVDFITDDLFRNEIFVITANGDRVSLPPNSTVLDYAYRVDERNANHITDAVVNTRKVGIQQKLHSCDKVEFEIDDKVSPTVEWLDYARTPFARMSIKKALKTQSPEEARDSGRMLLIKAVTSVGLVHSGKSAELENLIRPVADFLGLTDLNGFYENIGFGEIEIQEAVEALRQQRKRAAMLTQAELAPFVTTHPAFSRTYPVSIIRTEKNVTGFMQLCEFCAPVPGDPLEIRIYGKRAVLHVSECKHAAGKLFRWSRKAAANWDDSQSAMFPARLRIKLFHQEETYAAIRSAIAENGALFVTMQSGPISDDGLELLEVILEVADTAMLQSVSNTLLALRDIVVVTRI